MPYALLAVSIVFEVFGTTCMKLSEGFTRPEFVACVAVAYIVAFGVFVVVLRHMPLGLAYGIWGGLGTAGTTLVGIVVWNEPFTLFSGLGLALIIAGIVLLNAGSQQSIDEAVAKANASTDG